MDANIENYKIEFLHGNKKYDQIEFDFIQQPKRCHRFRYINDVKKSSHGVLLSNNSTTLKKEYPAVRIKIPKSHSVPSDLKLHILCLLCETLQVNGTENAIELSPHRLMGKVKANKGRQKSYDVDLHPINGLMEKSNSHEYIFELKEYFVLRTKKDELQQVVKEKYAKLIENKWPIDKIIQNPNNRIISKSNQKTVDSVCLCFIVFTKTNNNYQYYAGPIISNPINNDETIRIHKICNPFGTIKGGDDVTLLVQNVKKNDFKICLYEIGDNNQTVWSKEIDDKDAEFFPFAISFKTPKYDRIDYNKNKPKIKCFIQLQRKSDSDCSDAVPFQYVNYLMNIEAEDTKTKKRRFNTVDYQISEITLINQKLHQEHQEHQEHQQQYSTVYTDSNTFPNDHLPTKEAAKKPNEQLDIEMIIREIGKIVLQKLSANGDQTNEIIKELDDLNEIYMTNQNTTHTIYHDAIIKGNQFLKIYKIFDKAKISIPLQEAILHNGNTLLHTVCELDKSEYIRPLIGHGCRINAENIEGDTPLHVAIQEQSFKCLQEFQNIIIDPSNYEDFKEEFHKLLHVYNLKGYTILHLAVLNDLLDFVDNILKFCIREKKLDCCATKVSKTGDTILHLAVGNNLTKMEKIIMQHIPDAVSFENYSGITAFETLTLEDEWNDDT